MGDVIVLAVLAGVVLLAVRSLLKGRKEGKCSGCSGCSGGCSGCSRGCAK